MHRAPWPGPPLTLIPLSASPLIRITMYLYLVAILPSTVLAKDRVCLKRTYGFVSEDLNSILIAPSTVECPVLPSFARIWTLFTPSPASTFAASSSQLTTVNGVLKSLNSCASLGFSYTTSDAITLSEIIRTTITDAAIESHFFNITKPPIIEFIFLPF